MDKRYFVENVAGPCVAVMDRLAPNVVIAYCYDEHKAQLITMLLNDSWDMARQRSSK